MDSTIGLILQAVFRGRPDETSTSRLQNISLVEMIRTLNEVPAGLSVLARIQWLVFTMFNEGQYPASIIFNSMRATVLDYETEGSKISVDVSGGRSNTQFGLAMELQQWKSCELVSTLILLLAAPRRRESLLSALKFQSRALGGLPTLYATRTTPSASFQSTSHKAKEAALKDGKTTVLSVTLTDVHIFELAQRGLAEHYLSFAHTFTIGIGPDAVIVWQAWGKHGYSLDEYIRDGHARVRDLEEAEQFVKDFEKLASLKVHSSVLCT